MDLCQLHPGLRPGCGCDLYLLENDKSCIPVGGRGSFWYRFFEAPGVESRRCLHPGGEGWWAPFQGSSFNSSDRLKC